MLLAVETGLRLLGYGYSPRFFVKTGDGKMLTTNRRFGWQFMPRETATQPWPLRISLQKPPGVLRIFVLGESAAQGTPSPTFGFSRILEAMLERQYPAARFEVVNVAMRGINSHAIRLVARECAALDPDLFLIYMGNNETIGLHAPEPGRFTLTPYPRLLRASQWARATRLAQLVQDAARAFIKTPARKQQDMDFFRKSRLAADSPERRPVYDNFRDNLREILDVTLASGAKTVLSTVSVNLQDFPPLASLHRADLAPEALTQWEAAWTRGLQAEASGAGPQALAHYLEAARLDDHHAELHFRMARACHAAGQADPARRHFALARDWDALQFRADARLNRITRETAASRKNPQLELLDIEQLFADEAARMGGSPGAAWFHEHVHLTFDGDYLLARLFFEAASRALQLAGNPSPAALPSRSECAAVLGFSEWDELGVRAAMVRSTARPPFLDQADHALRQQQAEDSIRRQTERFHQPEVLKPSLALYRQAVSLRSNDWQIRLNRGNLFSDFQRDAEAVVEYRQVVRLMPEFLPARVALAQALWKTGYRQEAIVQWQEALKLDPACAPARDALRTAGLRPGRS